MLSVAERSHPTSEVRGRSREDPMAKGSGQEELPHVRHQGRWPRVPACDGAGTARGVTLRPRLGERPRGVTPRPRSGAVAAGRRYHTPPCPRPRAAARKSNHTPEARAVTGRTNPTSKEPWLHGCRRA